MTSRIASPLVCMFACFAFANCSAKTDPDPLATLRSPSLTGYQHRRALQTLDDTAPNDPATLEALARIVSMDGFSIDLREAALTRLEERDLAMLKITLRRTVPRTRSMGWRIRISEIIADRNWIDLSPALVSSWATPLLFANDLERPEFQALAKLHGPERIVDVVFDLLIESRGPGQEALRTRCWDLLHRLGQRERLIALLAERDIPADDAMLIDLKAAARELGLVPYNREEILWLRKLREPARADFWSRAVSAIQSLSTARRAELEIRDLPIIVSAALYEPELLATTEDDLYQRVHAYLRTQRHHTQEANYDGAGGARQMLTDFRGELTWGDLAAMLMAVRALQVPELVDHLFHYAERDKVDTSTEYGGVIALDGKDRFEVREFQPVMRRHDQEFLASQAMLDAAYTSLFHFHLHAQDYRNDKYAGPSFGDHNYADNTRANCLVFTFMNKDTMNVDFYRYNRVVIDLGEIRRPDVRAASVSQPPSDSQVR